MNFRLLTPDSRLPTPNSRLRTILPTTNYQLQLFLPLHESKLGKNVFEDLHANSGHVDIAVGGFQIEHKKIRMLVLHDITQHPSELVAVFFYTPTGFITQSVCGKVFE